MFVKICGITDADAVRAAAAAGADALGFVFAPSPRAVAPEKAAELATLAPSTIVRVAVFRHPSRAWFERVVGIFAPDWVQTDAEDLPNLRLPKGAVALPVWRNGSVAHGAARAPRVLFEGVRSGTGTTADWDEARALATATELVLAGGLSAANLAAAVRHVRPWGVDVSSGVEHAPGRKDPGKISEFVARVRALET